MNLKKQFRHALKFCKYNEEQIKIQKLTATVLKNNPKFFWREVSRRNGKLQSGVSDHIDGLKNPQEIADLFAVKFKAVNGAKDNTCVTQPSLCNSDFHELLELSSITSAISKLNQGVDGC